MDNNLDKNGGSNKAKLLTLLSDNDTDIKESNTLSRGNNNNARRSDTLLLDLLLADSVLDLLLAKDVLDILLAKGILDLLLAKSVLDLLDVRLSSLR